GEPTPRGRAPRQRAGWVRPPGVGPAAGGSRAAAFGPAGFASASSLARRFGFDRGFDVYDDHLPRGNDRRRTPYVERFADATTDAVLRWLEAPPPAGAGPWFVWVHYYDPHAPYEPPADLGERFRGVAYDGEIAFVDREIARLFRALDERKLTDRTVVLVTADHGESLGEHGEMTHGLFVYDATLRIPWLMAGPGVPR